jgi:hypothetical protein
MTHEAPSPLERLTDQVSRRLRPGEIGAIAARAGVGKTACLVQLGLAELVAGRPVLHVVLDQTVPHVREQYGRLFEEVHRVAPFENKDLRRLEVERIRLIQSYASTGFGSVKLGEAVTFVRDIMDFRPAVIVLDGIRITPTLGAELAALAHAQGFSLWLSVVMHRSDPVDPVLGLPKTMVPLADHLAVVVQLDPKGQDIGFRLVRDHGASELGPLPLGLDPASQLVVERPAEGR